MANATLVARFQRLSRLAGLAVLILGGLVFLGWALDNPLLNRLVAGRFIMQLNTGPAFIVAGAASWPRPRRWRRVRRAVMLGRRLHPRRVRARGLPGRPGRMEPETAARLSARRGGARARAGRPAANASPWR